MSLTSAGLCHLRGVKLFSCCFFLKPITVWLLHCAVQGNMLHRQRDTARCLQLIQRFCTLAFFLVTCGKILLWLILFCGKGAELKRVAPPTVNSSHIDRVKCKFHVWAILMYMFRICCGSIYIECSWLVGSSLDTPVLKQLRERDVLNKDVNNIDF